ncbi:MAG: trigger factor [Candidatus Sungbacteria bacterium RIFCSPLOWO2_01_FULL_60_25]|uniref:Trigger factor n=1 Tax=Candidatus Sungbacteria bacterium RIFCSPLOWO2_01_FULL_60_25 TaxID=1802281 RepID=A0A1G2LA29_9BACT|nr:MAG: trigger factor [Candidatus Sungbacteria bacterium RIFCSPLOWO2_01_FULL_60_25]
MQEIESQLNYSIEKRGPTELALDLTAPYADLEALFPKAAERLGAHADIEGFRKGKAPYEVLKQRLGEDAIRSEAARMHLDGLFPALIKELEAREFAGKSFEVIGAPAATTTSFIIGGDVTYRIVLSILPAITLPDYRAVAERILKTKNVPPVAEDDVVKAAQWLRESRTKLITVNRPAAKGDRVEVDFSARHGGAPLEGGASKNHPLIIGEGKFLPGFEDELIGMRAGEEKTFTINIPEDYPAPGLAGKTLEFAVNMRLVQERDLPAWDDAFAQSLGRFASADEMTASIRDGLHREKEAHEKERLRIAMVEAIAKETRADIPSKLVEEELKKMFAELKASVEGAGAPFDDYLAHIKKKPEDLAQEWREDAKRRVIFALVLREIGRREKIEPSDEDVVAAANRTALHRGMTDGDPKGIDRGQFIAYNRGVARNEKVFAFLENVSTNYE